MTDFAAAERVRRVSLAVHTKLFVQEFIETKSVYIFLFYT